MSADSLSCVKWNVDCTFGFHPDFKSYTGMTMSLGHDAVQGMSRKLKLTTSGSNDAELVGSVDAVLMVSWTKHFMEEQR
jgi:hypothetical protein